MRLTTFVATLAWSSFFALFWLLVLDKVDVLRGVMLMLFCFALALVAGIMRESAQKVREARDGKVLGKGRE